MKFDQNFMRKKFHFLFEESVLKFRFGGCPSGIRVPQQR